MSAPELGWYLRRLRAMSPAELAARGTDEARRRLWTGRQVMPEHSLPLPGSALPERGFAAVLPQDARTRVPRQDVAELVSAADRVLAGSWTVLGRPRPDSADPDWFLDPVTGRRAPDRELAFRVQHRDEATTGNIKQVWELSRHHQTTVLAAAYWLTEDEQYADAAALQLRSWWRQNPFLSGVHWTSGIEAGIRLVSWVWTRRLLDDWPKIGDLFEGDHDAVRQIAWHQKFLAGFPSRGSSANNHVLAEAVGRLVAASAFPWFRQSPRWRDQAARLLERELIANTFDDGLNRELATDYHRFVLELALLGLVEAEANDQPVPDSLWQCVGAMADAGAALLDVAGHPPRQGDGDEGRALVVDDPDRDPWAVALGSAAAVLGAAPWWPSVDGGVQAVLLGAMVGPRVLQRPTQRPDTFPDAGLVLLRSRPQDGPEIWCRCDGGPHGFLSIAAHAHADALSLELRHDGTELLVDPGTPCYHGDPEWRAWCRSTAAHNTLEVAGRAQSVSGGPFLWTRHARARTLRCEVGDRAEQHWSAEHDGYRSLRPATLHRRSVTLDSVRGTVTVLDELDTTGQVAVRLWWHLAPGMSVQLDGAVAVLTWSGRSGRQHGTLRLPPQLAWSAHTGETDPVAGWYAPRFGERVPATSLCGSGTWRPGSSVVTVLELPR